MAGRSISSMSQSGSSSSSAGGAGSRSQKKQHPTVFNGIGGSFEDMNNDYLCPICFELIEEAYITRCGHTFCYQCIMRSLRSSNRCPKCNFVIQSEDDIFPNVLLNELVSKYKNRLNSLGQGSVDYGGIDNLNSEGFRALVAAESEHLSLPEANRILEVLKQRILSLECESESAQNQLLHDFLSHLMKRKQEELTQLSRDVDLITKDLSAVEEILEQPALKYSRVESDLGPHSKYRKIDDSSDSVGSIALEVKDGLELPESGSSCRVPEAGPSSGVRAVVSCTEGFNKYQKKSSKVGDCTRLAARRQQMHVHFDDLVQCYFSSRSTESLFGEAPSAASTSDTCNSASVFTKADTTLRYPGLHNFQNSLIKLTKYNSLHPLATLNYSSDIFSNSTIVSSIEFDKDNEFFAIAGVTKKIKVYDFGTVIRDAVDIHYPCVEMVSNSKISCVSWSQYNKCLLASSDYEGTVTVWDVATAQKQKVFQEHEKRCWTVDFNHVNTRLIASGSDDARVKLWSTNMDHSVATVEAKANVCCVKFSPTSSCHLAFGSADHCVHYYDLRMTREPLALFKGHSKAVSYVKFLNNEEIVSASTDSQLKLWNVGKLHCLRTFQGHINEKNFVGLATDGDYIACGSENNALYIYYKGLSKHLLHYKFDSVRSVLEKDKKDEEANEFVSAVCWRQKSNVVVAANSQGLIKVLELV